MLTGMWSNRNSHSQPAGMQSVQPLWKTVWQFITKLNLLTIQFSTHAPWYLPKWVDNLCPHKNLHTNVYTLELSQKAKKWLHINVYRAVVIITKTWKQPRCPSRSEQGFPGGAVVESLPANAGDTGSGPGLGGSRVPRSNYAREPQLLSLRVWSLCSATGGAAMVRGPRTAMKSGPRLPRLEKALARWRRPNTAINKINK